MAKFQISESVEINRPPETVFQYVTDISKASEWRPNLSVEDYSGDPFGVGSTWRDVTKFMGRDMTVDVEITALEAGRHIEMKQEGSGFSGHASWDFSPGPDGSTTATLSFDGEATGWLGGLASGLMRNQAQKTMKRDLANLKTNLESG